MKYSTVMFVVAVWLARAQTSNPNGDPTDLSNYPSCIQACISPTFAPPVECGSLSNRTCICQNPLFTNAVAACALTKCSRGEVVDINQLFVSLCASVGGVDAILSEEDRLFATASLEIPAIPTYPLDVTGIDQASVILATATPAPNLGNPATGTDPGIFPPCVLLCAKLTADLITDRNNLAQVCGVDFRLQNAICKTALCTNSERQISQLLAQQLCGPYYRNNVSLGSSVSVAIASATPIAQAAVAAQNSSKTADYPECARNCILSSNTSGCGAFPNANCSCNNIIANKDSDECQETACEGDDIIRTATLLYLVCAPSGGSVLPANETITNQTATHVMVPSTTAVQQFTGGAGRFGSWTLALAPLVLVVVNVLVADGQDL